ncbi:N-acetyl sugar amidotransferase [Neisseria sp. HSC-16F19]|nr:N-acetyl sugar amidotransferase [Neisseria sp. HSC-16F19]MCP2041410.1 N-acetyl sugar amidotransferase [Neisseria sp. HSC-16F19]
MANYQQCMRCIMDNKSDEFINFDENGFCSYCRDTLASKNSVYFPNEQGAAKLDSLIKRLKLENKEHQYDCVMGISGGLDSSYLAYLGTVKWNLRVLAVHIDDGFDTDISKRNIERIARLPNMDLRVIQPDQDQFNALTKAYMRAGVPNLAVPQDNVLFASLYKFLKENKLRTFLSGGNFALECILQRGNTYDVFDLRNLKYINKKFGTTKLDKLTFLSSLGRDIDAYILKIESLRPLNLIEYNRQRALDELADYCGFEYYGAKHLENDLTRFIQQYWFYKKFHVDKRTSHLSSMIVSGQLSRQEALEEYSKPLYDELEMQKLISSILTRLDMDPEEFEKIMRQEPRQHTDYPTSYYLKLRPWLLKVRKAMVGK